MDKKKGKSVKATKTKEAKESNVKQLKESDEKEVTKIDWDKSALDLDEEFSDVMENFSKVFDHLFSSIEDRIEYAIDNENDELKEFIRALMDNSAVLEKDIERLAFSISEAIDTIEEFDEIVVGDKKNN